MFFSAFQSDKQFTPLKEWPVSLLHKNYPRQKGDYWRNGSFDNRFTPYSLLTGQRGFSPLKPRTASSAHRVLRFDSA